jgi:hypothetical protein
MMIVVLTLGLMLAVGGVALGLAALVAKRKERLWLEASSKILSEGTVASPNKSAKVIDIRSTRIGLGPMGSR